MNDSDQTQSFNRQPQAHAHWLGQAYQIHMNSDWAFDRVMTFRQHDSAEGGQVTE